MKIGIMGGTFNPIHHGHLILSEYIRTNFKLDKILFIPTGNPPHKSGRDVLNGDIRLKMVEIAIKSNENFDLMDVEIKRQGLSYTIDTLMNLKDIYKGSKLYLIVGADTLLSMHTWKDYEKILSMTSIIVADRLGLNNHDLSEEISRLNSQNGNNIFQVDTPIIEISSTSIRDRIKKGLSIKYLVPEPVENYIYKNELYK